jgi:hypothetical protein
MCFALYFVENAQHQGIALCVAADCVSSKGVEVACVVQHWKQHKCADRIHQQMASAR